MMGSLRGWARYAASLYIKINLDDGTQIYMRKSLNNPILDPYGYDRDYNDPDYHKLIWWINFSDTNEANDWVRLPIKDLDKQAWLQRLEPCKTLDDAKKVLGL